MTERYTEFLVDFTGKSPRNLKDSIRRIQNSSAGFTQSWLAGNRDEALETSHEAFGHLDYIQNELLRQRDVHKSNTASWPTSPYRAALSSHVGRIAENVAPTDRTWFLALFEGAGALPAGSTPVPLSLEKAMNKLKHRDTVAINFSIGSPAGHVLYLLTNGGMGQSDSISEINISDFCAACKSAASHV